MRYVAARRSRVALQQDGVQMPQPPPAAAAAGAARAPPPAAPPA